MAEVREITSGLFHPEEPAAMDWPPPGLKLPYAREG